MIKKNKLPDIVNNFSEWYQEVILQAGLADQSDVRGCITVLPYGCALWEKMTYILNKNIKMLGASNMMFPLLIPHSLFEKEKDHVEGFAPEVAVVTHAGGKKLEDPFLVRPTSEIIIHNFFKKKIKSWRDLPLKVNQWCSVLRWEKRPRAFLRTTEFWWQEGHTAHVDYDEAFLQAEDAIKMYEKFCTDFLAIPVISGKKPDYERFAGADITWTIEGMMQDGKAVQMGTSHLLGSGFAKLQNMEFQDKDSKVKQPFLTSWGVTTRLIGALIMVHGDAKGMVMPPYIAPVLFYIVPIFKNIEERVLLIEFIKPLLSHISYYEWEYIFDINDEVSPGAKFFESEVKGIPFRIEFGMKDYNEKNFTLYERDIHQKTIISITKFYDSIYFYTFFSDLKNRMQKRMLDKAIFFRDMRIKDVSKLIDFGPLLVKKNGFYRTNWCGRDEHLFKEYQSSVRCIFEQQSSEVICCLHDNCVGVKMKALVARSY